MGPEQKMNEGKDQRFELGRVMMTPGAQWAMLENSVSPPDYLVRHARGDWGEVDEHDRAENERSIKDGLRILSAYLLPDGRKLWVITEADRSATTILLPEDDN